MQSNQPSLLSQEEDFLEAVHSREPVSGLTHNFYHYPARFSHLFARAAIRLFTEPGEFVLDPFMGGGTTLVEAQELGRQSVGTDINSLAIFVSQVKTTPLSNDDIKEIEDWFSELPDKINLRNPPARAFSWIESGYQRNVSGKRTWPIRKTLELALAHINELNDVAQRKFVRCVLLKTGQWALHRRNKVPTATEFRSQLFKHTSEMLESIKQLSTHLYKPICLNRGTAGIESEQLLNELPVPKLILTSPPYPGVHVLYHRWQVDGRKETPAPFWIANSWDGRGASYYTFGSRSRHGLKSYYNRTEAAFASLSKIASNDTLLVQMVGFSERSWQLPAYIAMMQRAGFEESKVPRFANAPDGRMWRTVPNRKWYTYRPGMTESSQEVVLFHQLASCL